MNGNATSQRSTTPKLNPIRPGQARQKCPPAFLAKLDDVHRIKGYQGDPLPGESPGEIWTFGRTTGWRAIGTVIAAAGIKGVQGDPDRTSAQFCDPAPRAGVRRST